MKKILFMMPLLVSIGSCMDLKHETIETSITSPDIYQQTDTYKQNPLLEIRTKMLKKFVKDCSTYMPCGENRARIANHFIIEDASAFFNSLNDGTKSVGDVIFDTLGKLFTVNDACAIIDSLRNTTADVAMENLINNPPFSQSEYKKNLGLLYILKIADIKNTPDLLASISKIGSTNIDNYLKEAILEKVDPNEKIFNAIPVLGLTTPISIIDVLHHTERVRMLIRSGQMDQEGEAIYRIIRLFLPDRI